MLAIPVPFVVSLMLALLAVTLYVRLAEQGRCCPNQPANHDFPSPK
ncbi:hypothetical protein [Aeromonas salmonicida]|nr:hypothetical protein [Aeromonas salmonicida]